MSEPIKIHKFGGENVGIIKAASYEFGDNSLLVVGGKNEQGKSTFISLVEMALGGKDVLPPVPLRKGATNGNAWVDLGEYQVKRTFTTKGTELSIKTKDGLLVTSPQKLLDSLLAPYQLDILAITRMKSPKEQAQYVKSVLGIDTAKLDEEYKRVYETRTDVGRFKQGAWSRYAALEVPDDTPGEEVDIGWLAGELLMRKSRNAEIQEFARNVDRLESTALSHKEAVQAAVSRVEELTLRLEVARGELAKACEAHSNAKDQFAAAELDLQSMQPADENEIVTQITNAESINRAVRLRSEQSTLWDEYQSAETEYDQLTERLGKIDRQKQDLIAKIDLPGGLVVTDDGLFLDDLPFEQASASRMRRVILGILLAAKPGLPFYAIRDGSLLDEDAQREAAEMVDAAGAQLAVEIVGSEGATIVIQDGEIVARNGAKVAK